MGGAQYIPTERMNVLKHPEMTLIFAVCKGIQLMGMLNTQGDVTALTAEKQGGQTP